MLRIRIRSPARAASTWPRIPTVRSTPRSTFSMVATNSRSEVNLDANTTVTAGDDSTLTFHNTINLGANDLTLEPATGGLENGIVELNTSISGTGTVTNTATLATGLGPSLGNVNFDSSGALDFDITPNSAGQLTVGGTATLDGTINVDFLDGATPSGDVTLLTAGSPIVLPSGLPTLNLTGATGLSLALSGDMMSLLLTSAGLPGDYNQNGIVDAADYTLFRQNDGTNNPLPNDNGLGTPVGQAHYDLWVANFGNTGTGSGSAAAVPEPATALLMIMALTIVWGRHRSRCEFENSPWARRCGKQVLSESVATASPGRRGL